MAASSFHSSNLQRLFMISSSFFFHSKTRTINHLLSDLCLSTSTIRSESTRRVQLSFPRKLLFSCQAKLDFEADESFNINVVSPALLTTDKEMATQVAASSFNGNVKKALAGLRRINLEGLRWRVFDAKDQVLGRLASRISTVIQGKDKPTYTPNRDDGDMCIVLNAKDICVTGRKLTDKVYHWHTEQVCGQPQGKKFKGPDGQGSDGSYSESCIAYASKKQIA